MSHCSCCTGDLHFAMDTLAAYQTRDRIHAQSQSSIYVFGQQLLHWKTLDGIQYWVWLVRFVRVVQRSGGSWCAHPAGWWDTATSTQLRHQHVFQGAPWCPANCQQTWEGVKAFESRVSILRAKLYVVGLWRIGYSVDRAVMYKRIQWWFNDAFINQTLLTYLPTAFAYLKSWSMLECICLLCNSVFEEFFFDRLQHSSLKRCNMARWSWGDRAATGTWSCWLFWLNMFVCISSKTSGPKLVQSDDGIPHDSLSNQQKLPQQLMLLPYCK